MAEPIWYHVDVNSAFLSWTAAYRVHLLGEKVDLRTIPSVIGGNEKNRHGIVLAKSTPAKKYKIQTGEPLTEARKKCPGIVVAPPDYELYVQCSKALIEFLRLYSDDIHQYSIDEAFVNMTGTTQLFGGPVVFAHQLKQKIKEELGFTVNIGVASNKILAKMASEFRKPDRVHTLFENEIEEKLWKLPVGELFYVGRATTKKLEALGIKTIGELAGTDKKIIGQHLKKHGEMIWDYAHGVDVSPYLLPQPENKGYGNSMTAPFDVCDGGTAKQLLLSLTETVCTRMREDGMKAGCVSVSVTNSDFFHVSRQMTLLSETDITAEIYGAVCRVFDALWDKSPIRQIGVHTSKVSRNHDYQYQLFEDYERYSGLDKAVDEIRERYGEDAIMRGAFLNSGIPHMAGGIDKAKRTGITKGVLPG